MKTLLRARRRSALAVPLAVSVIAVGGFVTYTSAGATTGVPANRPDSAHIAPGILADFAIFRTSGNRRAMAATVSSLETPAVQRVLSSMLVAPEYTSLGLDGSATQAVTTNDGTVFAIPGSNGMCVVVADPVESFGAYSVCDAEPGAQSGVYATLGDRRTGDAWTYGVLPNGVSSVSSAKGREAAAVKDNAFILLSHRRPGVRGAVAITQAYGARGR